MDARRSVKMRLSEGCFMTTKKTRHGKKELYLDEFQNPQDNATRVHVWTRGKHFLFAFVSENEECYEIPCLVEGKLKLKQEKRERVSSLPNCYWFVKVNLRMGRYYSLRSMSEPRQYLAMSDDKRKVFTSTDPQRSLWVTDVKL